MFKRHFPTLVSKKSQQKRNWSWKESLSHWDHFWEIIWMGNFQPKSFYQPVTGDFSPGLGENRMNNQVTRTQKHLWPWLHDQGAVVPSALPHQYQTIEMIATGLQRALPSTIIMATARTSVWGQETQHLLSASPCFPLLLEVLKLAWPTLPPSHYEPQGIRSDQGEAFPLPSRAKALPAILVSWGWADTDWLQRLLLNLTLPSIKAREPKWIPMSFLTSLYTNSLSNPIRSVKLDASPGCQACCIIHGKVRSFSTSWYS